MDARHQATTYPIATQAQPHSPTPPLRRRFAWNSFFLLTGIFCAFLRPWRGHLPLDSCVGCALIFVSAYQLCFGEPLTRPGTLARWADAPSWWTLGDADGARGRRRSVGMARVNTLYGLLGKVAKESSSSL